MIFYRRRAADGYGYDVLVDDSQRVIGRVYKVHNRAQDDGRLLQGQSWAWSTGLVGENDAGFGTRDEATHQMVKFLRTRGRI